jgi:adenylate cyclase class 2
MEPLEIEIKFYLTAVDPVREALLQLGATAQPRVFETNVRYEDATESFVGKKMLLRLRTDRKTTLTLKRPPLEADIRFKVHRELEVEVGDFDAMDRILRGLGFHRAQCYEKWRQTLSLDDTLFCIDTLPFGDFLEIEGTKTAIPEMARRLGLPWERRILYNYLEIFDAIKRECNLPFTDVTFANFKHITFDMEPYRHRFETGGVSL